MAVLLWFLILMAMKTAMASYAAEVVSAHSGGAALLTSQLWTLRRRQDVRWTHPHLVMSLRNNVTACHHGRCRLLSDGSLSFSRVQSEDAGTYSLEVFDEDGRRLLRRDVLLTVDDLSSSSSSMSVSVLLVLFVLLLLVFIIIFIVRRRRSQRARTAGRSARAKCLRDDARSPWQQEER
ncbi:uncharacterized protein LOC121964557 isoform X2 [Plectropomus leopardus]|uniref:uncharacterized protein LOC121964557 isoform X2 n=1 Tax=Plectropomus leopardus TaxID=160734 RepID=UPI001C4AECA6|nr:uncharacterized protein LOC121964557 isoform X2 [Plectropomus leopardus]